MGNEEYATDFYKGPAYALVIGIRKYKYGTESGQILKDHEFPNLQVADKDAQDFADFLTHYGFIKYNVQVLINEQAELSNIKDEFDTLRRNCLKSGVNDPLVIVYFSGHGWADADGRHYLIPYEAQRNRLPSTALLNREFNSLLTDIKTNRMVVFLDACHAGAMGAEGEKGALQQYDFHKDLGEGEGRYLIASCGPGQKSYEWKERKNSIFTGHLLELLRCETEDFDKLDSPEIDIFNLYPTLRDKVIATARKEYGQDQEPISDMKGGKGIVLAINGKVRQRKQLESDQLIMNHFLELICVAIKSSPGTVPKISIAQRLESYVRKGNKLKGYDDFYGIFDEQKGIWEGSRNSYSFEEGCILLIDADESARAKQKQITEESAKPFDKLTSEKAMFDSPDRRPQEKDLAQTIAPPQLREPTPTATEVESKTEKPNNIVNIRTQVVRGDPIESPRLKVFISYSHKDKKWLGDVETMLAPLIRKGTIDLWDDTQIEPGEIWKDEIEKALASTKVAVLLVSANFLASDFIVKNELPPLLNDAQNKGVVIYWILVSACLVEETEIINYQAAHDVSRPLDQLSKPDRQAVLSEVGGKIRQLIR